jgi:hypothetical protein
MEHEERRLFWQQFHEDASWLRQIPAAWQQCAKESKELDGTLMDGIDADEDWSFLGEARADELEFLPPATDRVSDQHSLCHPEERSNEGSDGPDAKLVYRRHDPSLRSG